MLEVTADGEILGTIDLVDASLVASSSLAQSIVDSWRVHAHPDSLVYQLLTNWSNGYMVIRPRD